MIPVKIAGIRAQSRKKVVVMTVKKVARAEQTSIMPKLIALLRGCAPTLRGADKSQSRLKIIGGCVALAAHARRSVKT